MRTIQQMFETAVYGLVKQGKPSRDKHGCKYRGPNDTRCAVGFLIEDDTLAQQMDQDVFSDGTGIKTIFEAIPHEVARALGCSTANDVPLDFLDELQGAHDNCLFNDADASVFIRDWLEETRRLAWRWGLKMPADLEATEVTP